MNPPMLDKFVQMIQRIIREDGFDNYLPTLLLPAQRVVRVMDGTDADDEGETLGITEWVSEQVEADEDFMVAFKMDEATFMVLGRINGEELQQVCAVEG